jgi:hypothetical protein
MNQMTDPSPADHPITPPAELIDKWKSLPLSDEEIFVIAARWGADQELEACCEWLTRDWTDIETTDKLRTARRALEQLNELDGAVKPGVGS